MKILKHITIALSSILAFTACDEDFDKVSYDASKATASQLAPLPESLILEEINAEKVAATFSWSQSDFKYSAAVTYEIEVDAKGNDFKNAEVLGAIPIDNSKTTMTFDIKTSVLNAALNLVIENNQLDGSEPIEYEFRIVSKISTTVEPLYSNIVNSTISVFLPDIDIPGTMNIIGSPYDWNWDNANQLTVVNGFAGTDLTPSENKAVFWMLQYCAKDAKLKFNYNKAWDGAEFGYSAVTEQSKSFAGITDDGGNINVGNAGWYIVVVTTTRSANRTELVSKVDFFAPNVYLMGNTAGSWSIEDSHKFTVPADATSEFVSPAFVASDELRICVNIDGYDWWRTEFIILDGKIAYRGNGGDQARVTVTTGQKAYLNFSNNTGKIE